MWLTDNVHRHYTSITFVTDTILLRSVRSRLITYRESFLIVIRSRKEVPNIDSVHRSLFFFFNGFSSSFSAQASYSVPYSFFTDGRAPWASDQPVARPLPKRRTTQTQNKRIHTPNIHALSGIRTHDPSFRASEDSSCLRPRDHCDRHRFLYASIIITLQSSSHSVHIYIRTNIHEISYAIITPWLWLKNTIGCWSKEWEVPNVVIPTILGISSGSVSVVTCTELIQIALVSCGVCVVTS
jgi:hypothetical protein